MPGVFWVVNSGHSTAKSKTWPPADGPLRRRVYPALHFPGGVRVWNFDGHPQRHRGLQAATCATQVGVGTIRAKRRGSRRLANDNAGVSSMMTPRIR